MTPETLAAIWARHNADRQAALAKDDPWIWTQAMEDRRVLLQAYEYFKAASGEMPDTGYEGRREMIGG